MSSNHKQNYDNRRRKNRSAPETSNSKETLEGKAKKRIQQYIMFTEETYKTELCRSFQATRTCPYGLECRFAHGINELAPRIFEKNVFKTEPCLHFKKEGRCKFGTRCRYLHDEVRIQLNDKVTVLYSETEAILRGITHNDDGTISVQSHAYYPVFNLLQLFGDNDGFVKRGSMKNETYSAPSLMSEMSIPKKAATRRSPVTAEEVSVMINRLSLPHNEPGQWGVRPKACETFGDFTEELEQLNKRFEGRPHHTPRSPLPPRSESASKPESRYDDKPRSPPRAMWNQPERTPTSPQLSPVKKLADSVSRRSPRPNPLSIPMSLSSKSHSLTGFGRESPPYEDFVSTPSGSSTSLNKNRFPWRDDPFPSHESSSFPSPSSSFSSPTRESRDSFSSSTPFTSPSSYSRYDRSERNFGMSPHMNDPLRQPFRHFRASHDF